MLVDKVSGYPGINYNTIIIVELWGGAWWVITCNNDE